jgi:hypothetical protein
MSDDEQIWLAPANPSDMAPLPAISQNGEIFLYNGARKVFEAEPDPLAALNFYSTYASFEECRAAMIDDRVKALDMHRQICREHAAAIEHIKTIPTQRFPNVIREVREAEQVEGQAEKPVEGQVEGQEQGPQEAVTQAARQPARARRANGK